MEDVYLASVETDRGVKEQLRLYDTRGLQEGVEVPKHYFSVADGFVLVYAVTSLEAFQRVELLKKEIDVFRDKKEVTVIVLGNKTDLVDQRCLLQLKTHDSFSSKWEQTIRKIQVGRDLKDHLVPTSVPQARTPSTRPAAKGPGALTPTFFSHWAPKDTYSPPDRPGHSESQLPSLLRAQQSGELLGCYYFHIWEM
ncbi:NF-kappa-B inhibitor-interacting Ras-like protein 1 isoform X2 [Lathamus discolor]